MCKLMGIQDMYCKVDGSTNLLNITRALFTGLANQVLSLHRPGQSGTLCSPAWPIRYSLFTGHQTVLPFKSIYMKIHCNKSLR